MFKQSSTTITSLDVLDTQKELQTFRKALQRVSQNTSGNSTLDPAAPKAIERSSSAPASHNTSQRPRHYSAVNLEIQPGSVSAFRTLLTLKGATIIHYGGHGDDDGCLLFEGSRGDGVAMSIQVRGGTNVGVQRGSVAMSRESLFHKSALLYKVTGRVALEAS